MTDSAVRSRRFAIRLGFALALAAPAALPAARSAVAGDKDCGDFKSRKAMKRYFKKNGGPRNDPDNLDADNDGKPCEDYDY